MKVPFFLAVTLALSVTTAIPATADKQAATSSGQVVVVQAAPGMAVDLSIDGRPMSRSDHVGKVLGPFRLSAGSHMLKFTQSSGGAPVTSVLDVRAGSSSDVVLHFPASVGGRPLVTSYATPLAAIGPAKARLLVAHTATVAPADVQFDGKTVFRNIANGEFAQADVPEGTHEVALLATGTDAPPLLGPLDVTLEKRTVTMVYAVGTPKNGSMNVITHTVHLTSDGALAPSSIDTGSAGLAADIRTHQFPMSSTSSASLALGASAPASWLPVVLRSLLLGSGRAPQ